MGLPPAAEPTPEAFVAGSRWTFARTMPDAPHEYTLRDQDSRAPALSEDVFDWFVLHIRRHGYVEHYGGLPAPKTMRLDGVEVVDADAPLLLR